MHNDLLRSRGSRTLTTSEFESHCSWCDLSRKVGTLLLLFFFYWTFDYLWLNKQLFYLTLKTELTHNAWCWLHFMLCMYIFDKTLNSRHPRERTMPLKNKNSSYA